MIGVTMQERTSLEVDFPWTHSSRPMIFWHLTGNEEISASGMLLIEGVS